MHFQVINDDFYGQLLSLLRMQVPEFVSVFDEEDGVYPILGEFARFIISNFGKEELMIKCFNFINTAMEKGKHETEDAIVVQIFEQLYGHRELISNVKSYLKGKALEIFEKYSPNAQKH